MWLISRTPHNMFIMRSLFTCQRDIGINTPKNLTWPTCFAQKQKTERKTCTKSTFCCFPSSMNKSQSLFSLLKVWPGVPGELLVKWIDMQDRQQEKNLEFEKVKKSKDVLKVESQESCWSSESKHPCWRHDQENRFVDKHYQDRRQRKAKTFNKVKRSKDV